MQDHNNTVPARTDIPRFRLTENFLDKYKAVVPPFGFNGLGELVYQRTYSRIKADGTNEVWWETVKRVVEGTYNMQKRWIVENRLGWDERKAQRSAQEMYDRIFSMKFLPPGRGLWAMGSPMTEERGVFAALFNCAFCSTENIDKDDPADPFCFMMDMSMVGVGVGFDVKGAGKLNIKQPRGSTKFVIPDTREGWVEALRLLVYAFVKGHPLPEYDYSGIRPAGDLIKGFGGVASGPEPLTRMLDDIARILSVRIGQQLTQTDIADIMNMIGRCVVAGNVRRTAQIMFGDPNSEEYRKLKDYRWDSEAGQYVGEMSHRADYGWASNNSVFCELGMDYADVAAQTGRNGEPGYAWLENMRAYSRMGDAPDNRDKRVAGANPCVEQSLEDKEMCCLVETFPYNHDSLEDFMRTLKFAYLYAKTVTLCKTHWEQTNRVMLRNRRIGLSMSGIQQFVAREGINEFKKWCESGYNTVQRYDEDYSDWMAIPRSIKSTSIKPSGTVSLLAGATPGMHWPEDLYYIRRMRLSKYSELIPALKKAGYVLEPCVGQESTTLVVEIPVKIDDHGGRLRTVKDVSIWEQVAMAAFIQRCWADNQVSCTVTFNPETESDQISHVLDYFQYSLKGISFLPRLGKGAYAQMPYESIDAETYEARAKKLKTLKFSDISNEEADLESEKYCSNDSCAIR